MNSFNYDFFYNCWILNQYKALMIYMNIFMLFSKNYLYIKHCNLANKLKDNMQISQKFIIKIIEVIQNNLAKVSDN